MRYMTRRRIWELLQPARRGDGAAFAVNLALLTLIALNVLAAIISTVPELPDAWHRAFRVFEVVSVIVFTIEYALRVWLADIGSPKQHPVEARVRHVFTPMMLVDLLAILPFYFLFMYGADGRMLRAFRLLRVFRIFKFGRYSRALQMMGRTMKAKTPELCVTATVLAILLIISASLMYYAENGAQPEKFSSIPAALWWAVATLTTVGYGDVYPITPIGRLLGGFIAVLGIGLFALPAGILASGFTEQLARHRDEQDADEDEVASSM